METPSPLTRREKRLELGAFAFLALILAPILTIVTVGGFGLMVWIWQMIHGPPGPPPS